jgi:transposase
MAEWQSAGVWDELQRVLLDRLRTADRLDFSRATVDASHVQSKRGRSRPKVGPSPVDRARPGSKHHVLTDGNGIPLRVSLTGAHRNDVTQLLPLVDGLPPVRGKRGRPRRKPRAVFADRGCDHDIYRRRLRERNITPKIAGRGQAHGSGLGRVLLGRRIRYRPSPRPASLTYALGKCTVCAQTESSPGSARPSTAFSSAAATVARSRTMVR